MVIVTLDGGRVSDQTNVVESGERSSVYVFDGVIWNQKVFLPSHEQKLIIFDQLFVIELVVVKAVYVRFERREFAPMFSIDVLVSVPLSC